MCIQHGSTGMSHTTAGGHTLDQQLYSIHVQACVMPPSVNVLPARGFTMNTAVSQLAFLPEQAADGQGLVGT